MHVNWKKTILSDFKSFLDDNEKQFDQQSFLKIITKMFFCLFKIISQIPIVLNETKTQIKQNQEILQNKIFSLENEVEKSINIHNLLPDYEPNIFKACSSGKLTSVEWLIEKDQQDPNTKDRDGNTLLHYSCENGHFPIVKYLISKGVDIETTNHERKTPLHIATEHNNLPIIKYLISKGAKIDAQNSNSRTPLHIATEKGFLPIVEYLLDRGGSI